MHVRPGGPGPLNSNLHSIILFPLADFFFKSILTRRNWRGGGDWLLKNGTIEWWLRLLALFLPGPDLHCAGLFGTLEVFATSSSQI